MGHHQPNRDTLAQELQEVRKELDEWRRLEGAPKRIPEAIWRKATEIAVRHGVGGVAAGLRIDHTKLKSKVAAARASDTTAMVAVPQGLQSAPTNFVELFGAPQTAPASVIASCVLQVESARGSRLMLEVSGLDAPGLALLLKEFA